MYRFKSCPDYDISNNHVKRKCMPLNQNAKDEFIKNHVRDLTAKLPNPSAEVMTGMEEYAKDLCDRIVDLIKRTEVTNAEGSGLGYKLK